MKALLLTVLGVMGVAATHAAMAGADMAKMEDCFRKHSHLMEKPALRNVRACWYAHGYLMDR